MKLCYLILLTTVFSLLLAGVGTGVEAALSAPPAPALLQAVTVRGRVIRQINARTYPAGRMRVRLKPAGSNVAGQIAFTASDGMYSFRNVAPGNYVIEVLGGSPERVLKSLTVQVPNRSLVDVPQLVL